MVTVLVAVSRVNWCVFCVGLKFPRTASPIRARSIQRISLSLKKKKRLEIMKILKWRGGGGVSVSFGGRPVNPLIQHSDSDWKNGNVCQTLI